MPPESTRERGDERPAGEREAPRRESSGAVATPELGPEPGSGPVEPQKLPGGPRRRQEPGGETPRAARTTGRRVQGLFVRLFLGGLIGMARLLPMPWAERFGSGVGDLLFWCVPRYRAVARRNLAAALGWEAPRVEAVARQVFRNIGKTLVEFLRMPIMSPAEIRQLCELEGFEHVRAGLAAGRGVLLITGHYGNWELIAARLVAEGLRLNVVARDADDPATNAIINGIREQCGYRVIPRQSAPRGVLAALRRNELVAMLIDQNTIEGGEFVPFFGRLAATVTGPAVLALRTGAAVIPGFVVRRPDDTHVGVASPAVELPGTGDRERDVRELTGRLTALIEAQVRADPTQWFWIHDRWRHRPPEERGDRTRMASDRRSKQPR
jgi:KDO2-lipid IV(A) lauroyltransferase